jgi:t-SNARE complex subunit (syntaxin)
MKQGSIQVDYVGHDEFTRALLAGNDEERLRLAGSMEKVNEMFKDTQQIATEQGEMLDRIDVHTSEAVGHTKKAVEQLEITDQRQRNKKFCVCSVMVMTVVGVVALIVVLTVIV